MSSAVRVNMIGESHARVTLNPDGTVGEAHLATAPKGKAACTHQITGFINLLRQVRDPPIGDLSPTKDGPS